MGTYLSFGDHLFASKADLIRTVKHEIAEHPLNQVFESPLVSDLILYRHPYCRLEGLRPETFCKRPPAQYRAGYHFQAWFPSVAAWHPVSWHKAVNPPSYEDEVRKFLRWNIEPLLAEARGLRCEHCGSTLNLETDHKDPTFDQMWRAAAPLLTIAEISTWAYYQWDNVPGFRLPPTHPVFRSVMAAHQTAIFQTLCRTCHQAETKRRNNQI